MQDPARVYAAALFDVAKERGKLETIGNDLAEFADAVKDDPALEAFLFNPQLGTEVKVEGLKQAVSEADPELDNFHALLIEKQRMPAVFHIQREFERLWKQENERIDVTVTSAVELEPDVVAKIREEIERQTGQEADLTSRVDSEILGGIVLQVGDKVVDASIRSRLEKLRKNVAQVA